LFDQFLATVRGESHLSAPPNSAASAKQQHAHRPSSQMRASPDWSDEEGGSISAALTGRVSLDDGVPRPSSSSSSSTPLTASAADLLARYRREASAESAAAMAATTAAWRSQAGTPVHAAQHHARHGSFQQQSPAANFYVPYAAAAHAPSPSAGPSYGWVGAGGASSNLSSPTSNAPGAFFPPHMAPPTTPGSFDPYQQHAAAAAASYAASIAAASAAHPHHLYHASSSSSSSPSSSTATSISSTSAADLSAYQHAQLAAADAAQRAYAAHFAAAAAQHQS
jgi:hypothetical protein